MSAVKGLLKAARQALNDKDNAGCIAHCDAVLEQDPRSYNALVFAGLANSNLGDFAAGKNMYQRAIEVDQTSLLAWQGLLALLEKSGEISQYLDTASRIAAIHADANDEAKCFLVIDKAVNHARQFGTPSEVAVALKLILPVSPFFRLLEDKLPPVADSYVELAQKLEAEEAGKISFAISKGRTRLGVKLDQLTKDVKNDVYSSSQLESIYEEIINWSLEEAVRRDAENKLLTRIVDRLYAARAADKKPIFDRAFSTARGMTIVKVPNFLAWSIALNWNDYSIGEIDLDMIMLFYTLFPQNGIAKALHSFLWCDKSPIKVEKLLRYLPEDETQKTLLKVDANETILSLLEIQEETTKEYFLLCGRALLYLYDRTEDWEPLLQAAALCLKEIGSIEVATSAQLKLAEMEARYHLAHAMVHYRSPKFHDQALEAFDVIMKSGQEQIYPSAAIGKAAVLRHRNNLGEAKKLLQNVLQADPENSAAQLELAQCSIADHEYDNALESLQGLSSQMSASGSRSVLATIHYLMGRCYESLKNNISNMYAAYIQALRYDPNHAPTYTALGIYYADEVNDPLRAEKCFQKALELSPAELKSAHRLAAVFADDGDWELVEIIAQRVIQGNERLEVSWPYRALGFVHLNTGKNAEAVSSFQLGLRLATKDVDAWIGLGEAYFELGRYTAAEKAFGRASLLDPENWYAKYLTASVASALGEHNSACTLLESMLESEPSAGVRSSLASAYISWTKALLSDGWVSKARLIAQKALRIAYILVTENKTSFACNLMGQAAKALAEYPGTTENELAAVADEILTTFKHSDLEQSILANLEYKSFDTINAKLAYIAVRSFIFCLEEQDLKDDEEAAIWSNIANALQLLSYCLGSDKLDSVAAIEAMQCAIKLDPRNETYWIGLGLLASSNDLPLSQHCLIKATSLNPKSASHWTVLGFFYLKLHHQEAANLAFLKAQSLEPSSSLAWLGQACLAHDMGEDDHELFEHAVRLSASFPGPLTAIRYIESVFRQPVEKVTKAALRSAMFVVDQALKQSTSAHHRRTLQYYRLVLLERQSSSLDLIETADALANDLEMVYETDESDSTLSQYCDAKAVLARLMLRAGRYEEALENATSVIELDPPFAQEALISCTIVSGISQCLSGEQEEAISTLRGLCEQYPDKAQFMRTLAQVLISSGDNDEQGYKDAMNLLKDNHTEAASKLLLVTMIVKHANSSAKETSLAQALLNSLMSHPDEIVRRQRDLLEQKLSGRNVLYSQIHHDPANCKTWLRLARSIRADDDNAIGEKQMALDMALRYAKQSSNIHDLALVCHSSNDLADRATSLHIAPQNHFS